MSVNAGGQRFGHTPEMRKWLDTRLKELRDQNKNKNKVGLADALGIAPSRITQIINGTRRIHSTEVEPMARYLEWPESHLLDMIGGRGTSNVGAPSKPSVNVPVISWVQAGRYAEITDPYPPGAHDREVLITHDKTTLIALTVQGGSMNRIAPEGSTIIVDYSDKQLISGKCYVIKSDGEATFKRYRANPTRFEPHSYEEGHETIYPAGPVDVVGKVIKVITDID
jgi:SOS-response transcriptional repressor LexA